MPHDTMTIRSDMHARDGAPQGQKPLGLHARRCAPEPIHPDKEHAPPPVAQRPIPMRTHLAWHSMTDEPKPLASPRYNQTLRRTTNQRADPAEPCPGTWWRRSGSNRRPPACKAGALPAELRPLDHEATTARRRHLVATALPSPTRIALRREHLVGQGGFEPPTPRLSSVCSNQLSY
jgi:hypothetical protein